MLAVGASYISAPQFHFRMAGDATRCYFTFPTTRAVVFPPKAWIYGRHNMAVLYSRRLCVALNARAMPAALQPASWGVTTHSRPFVAHSVP
jgi:hypothetical protein